jgi:hypothetical protein
MRTADHGFAAISFAPCRVTADGGGQTTEITCDTEYPFRETVSITVTVDRPGRFPVLLRIPGWAAGATVKVDGGAVTSAKAGTFHRVEREWSGSTTITLHFPMKPLMTVRYNDNVAIERGPLVYALRMGEEWTRINADKPHRELPHGDWEVRPTTPWNYGIVVEKGAPVGLTFTEKPVGGTPFSPDGPGVVAKVSARRVPSWGLARGWASEISSTDAEWADASKTVSKEPIETVELIPYGCTNIRITEFPRVRG